MRKRETGERRKNSCGQMEDLRTRGDKRQAKDQRQVKDKGENKQKERDTIRRRERQTDTKKTGA